MIMETFFSPDGKRMASVYPRTVKVRDLETGQEVMTLEGHLHRIRSVAFSPDGTRIASVSNVHLWNLTDGNGQTRQ